MMLTVLDVLLAAGECDANVRMLDEGVASFLF